MPERAEATRIALSRQFISGNAVSHLSLAEEFELVPEQQAELLVA